MDEVFERVVAENRQLRKEVKGLRERVVALESSRWWRLHPRVVLRRLQRPVLSHGGSADSAVETSAHAKDASVARQWRLKLPHEQRNRGADADEIVLREGIRLNVRPDSRSSFAQFG